MGDLEEHVKHFPTSYAAQGAPSGLHADPRSWIVRCRWFLFVHRFFLVTRVRGLLSAGVLHDGRSGGTRAALPDVRRGASGLHADPCSWIVPCRWFLSVHRFFLVTSVH
jgi:hypothetical protein